MTIFLILAALLQTEREPSAQQFFSTASKQFVQRQFAEAKLSFNRAIASDAAYAEAYRGLGMTDLELKDYNGAYHAWLKAVQLDPKDEKSLYFLGRLFYEADFPNEAAAWLRQALKLNPNDFQVITYLGLCAEALSLDDTAAMLYPRAVALSKAQHKPFSWAFLSWGNFLRKRGDEKQALDVLTDGAQQCPEAHELTAYAELLAKHNDPDRAEQVLRQAILLDPSLSQPHYRLALLLKANGRNEESRSEMDRFLRAKADEDKNSKIIALRK